ncbi:carboxy-cis,cis-muconate cyclase [Trichoderma arundinaceum]|uniref:Carboxy-cis,cis-muconate cyclase n=1 Tax=Trichoderma arundinaceum TaxID=490622 RepID=A0A395NRT5_TRIAR|nr:carboxy-cis,cis-muconate cyclase [Trichoderma arundinaceum]
MRFSSTVSAALAASPAFAAPTAEAASPARVVYANSGHIYLASYDGSRFTTTANSSFPNTDPSWLAFVEPNLLYAVNDIASNTFLYNVDINGNTIKQVTNKQGSGGVVHLEVNKAKTRMLGAGYGSGKIDVWNIENGGLKLIKSIQSPGPASPNQDGPHPHQSVNDPTGRYFFVNDLGTDSILVIDSQNDAFNIVNRVSVVPAGTGPRHGVFYPFGAAQPSHYFVLCELGNVVISYRLNYTDNGKGVEFTTTQVLNSFGPNNQVPAGAGAGELVLSPDNKDLYLSNRLTGQATDNIAHIKIIQIDSNSVALLWINSVSSGGTGPRMFSISNDGNTLFVTNQNGALGVAAISRNATDGSLDPNFHGTISNNAFGGDGPQYIKQLQ